RAHVRDPVTDGPAVRLIQRPGPELDRSHFGAQQRHPLHVRALPAHVLGAHVHDAFEPEASADGGGRDPVLARAGLGDDPVLAEAPCEQGLAERVVELVRSRVQEILPLEVEALPGREALRSGERRRPAAVLAPQSIELSLERAVLPGRAPARLELVERRDQGLGHEATAVGAVEPSRHRAAATNSRTRAWSLAPGETSRLELASTAQGRTASIASRTFSGPRPPASMTRPPTARARSRSEGSSCSHGRSTTLATCSSPRSSTASRLRWPFSRPYSW